MSTQTLPDMLRAFGRIGLLSFGGPAAQIAIMHEELIERRRWLTEDQFLRALSLCMLLPGPEAMQLATYAGWRIRGVVGGLLAGLLFVVPGALVIFALAFAYTSFGQVPLVQAAFCGHQGCGNYRSATSTSKTWEQSLRDQFCLGLSRIGICRLVCVRVTFPSDHRCCCYLWVRHK